MPWMGTLAQVWGRKNLFLLSILLFAVGSAVCGSALDLNILIAGRVIQGLGDGGIISLSEILIADLVPLSERGTYEGLLGSVWALASAIGPPIGGALGSKDHWRWLFYMNIPISFFSAVFIFFFLVNRAPEATLREKIGKMDWCGNITVIASLCCLTLALTWGGTRFAWVSAPVLVTLLLGAILFVSFFVYELRYAKYATIPPSILTTGTARSAYASTFLHGIVSMAVIYLLPSYFQACLYASPIRSGIMILPLALTIAPFAIFGAVAIEYTERYILINYAGWAFTILGAGLLILLRVSPPMYLWILVQIPLGIGLGFLFVAPQFPVLAAVPLQLAAPALATYTFVSSLGQTLGIAIGDAALQSTVRPLLSVICDSDAISSTLSVVQDIHKLQASVRHEVVLAYIKGFRVVWIVLLPFSVAGLCTCLALRTIKMHTEVDEDYYALADGGNNKNAIKTTTIETDIDSNSNDKQSSLALEPHTKYLSHRISPPFLCMTARLSCSIFRIPQKKKTHPRVLILPLLRLAPSSLCISLSLPRSRMGPEVCTTTQYCIP
jgi:MFS family permease